jgi:membrane-associated phospholipid phosphatase
MPAEPLLSATSPGSQTRSRHLLRRLVHELAPQDWLVLIFVVSLNVASYAAADSPQRARCIHVAAGMLAVVIYGSVQLSYFFLGWLLPVLNSRTLDTELYDLDLALFGFEPALAMDRWVSDLTTEWFAFFYYSYFLMLTLHVLPILFGSRSQRLLGEFTLGMLLVFCVGHVGYMLVPGYGPYWALTEQFQRPLPSGLWADLVMATVASGGSQLDIFPSLHTAAPAFIALYSFRHRHLVPYRYSFALVAFFAVNIILATMFLRYHYVIDVLAGLVLAWAASVLSVRLTDRELARRALAGLSPNWPLFFQSQARDSSQIAAATHRSG